MRLAALVLLTGCVRLAPQCDKPLSGFLDIDGDGYGGEAIDGCVGDPWIVSGGGDCDDGEAAAFPRGPDEWYDGIDGNCDGKDDFDQDGDLYPSDAYGGGDCDDTDPDINPGQAEEPYNGVDDACDGGDDYDADGDGDRSSNYGGSDCNEEDPTIYAGAEEIWYDGIDQACDGGNDFDQDGDGVDLGPDCDDTAPGTNPDATEIPYDGIDQDCDGVDPTDLDSDGWDSDAVDGGDCDDARGDINPGATEVCDGLDNNCDSRVDEGFDIDGDGFSGCYDDCDDTLETGAAIYPGATEIWYDGVDQDCDDASDDDQDGDGYDSDTFGAGGGNDCNDTDPAINPAAIDFLDYVDNDCMGVIDDPDAESVAIAVVRGDSDGQAVGSGGVALDADLNGDSEDELVLSSPSDDGEGTNAGAVWVFGWSELGDVPVTNAWLTIVGENSGDRVGAAVATGLDWDGNGVGDLAVGAPGAGAIYLMEPETASDRGETADDLAYRTITGVASSDFGAAICACDLDGDGTSDIVVGAPGAGSGKGAIYLFMGGGTATTYSNASYTVPGTDSGDAIGSVLACGGDVSGDGLDDIAIGVPNDDENSRSNSGSVFLVRGATFYLNLGLGLESVDNWTMTGSAADQRVGTSVTIANVSGSANADLIVGAPGYVWAGGTGAVGVFEGNSTGTESFTSADRLIRGEGGLGSAVGGSSDLDGDGTNDLLLGASGSDESAAWLVTLTGTVGTLDLLGDQLALFRGGASQLGAGVSATARDLDGDGVLEVAVAATENAGAVYVLNVFP